VPVEALDPAPVEPTPQIEAALEPPAPAAIVETEAASATVSIQERTAAVIASPEPAAAAQPVPLSESVASASKVGPAPAQAASEPVKVEALDTSRPEQARDAGAQQALVDASPSTAAAPVLVPERRFAALDASAWQATLPPAVDPPALVASSLPLATHEEDASVNDATPLDRETRWSPSGVAAAPIPAATVQAPASSTQGVVELEPLEIADQVAREDVTVAAAVLPSAEQPPVSDPVEAAPAPASAPPGAALDASAAARKYGALISTELNRRRRYPEAARAANQSGMVLVAFTIGPDGRISTFSIVQSSGHRLLDEAVGQMMSNVSVPPPPEGEFSATVPIRFQLTR
jgi:TonB family protein